MKVLAVTCYTGDEDLAAMTARCLKQLEPCIPEGLELSTSVVGQGTTFPPKAHINTLTFAPRNIGFAFGMNLAIQNRSRGFETPDHVLCFNNDLEFPDPDWLRALLEIAVHPTDQVIVPATDSAAIRVQAGPVDKNSYPVEESSAYCWLVPFKFCQWLKKTHGFWLFDEDFAPAYGEDNWTAFLLSKQFGKRVFRMVPRAWVKHLRARTSRIVEHDRAKTSQLLVDKLEKELSDPSLRPDLRRWAQRYIKTLTRRTK